uniref:Uncharacterized protein n=1 Tax=Picea glauca TaxID=3330 RepID=A0A101LWX3_PICGL|nr:hypothetical protein ABT39_MTgene6299 [Picea glauca]QHR88003.1 hypothetical protein Q903MT_gene2015 [Picea sitchensis]
MCLTPRTRPYYMKKALRGNNLNLHYTMSTLSRNSSLSFLFFVRRTIHHFVKHAVSLINNLWSSPQPIPLYLPPYATPIVSSPFPIIGNNKCTLL